MNRFFQFFSLFVFGFGVLLGVPPSEPTVTKVNPASGPVAGGNMVNVRGTNFIEGETEVFFSLVNPVGESDIQFISDTHLQVLAPAHTAGTVHVRVSTPGGTSAATIANEYTYVAFPTVTNVLPDSGPEEGGTPEVVITGTHFIDVTAVQFGRANAMDYKVLSHTQIIAIPPAGINIVHVHVTAAGGRSTAAASNEYVYLARPPLSPTVTLLCPAFGPSTGGNVVDVRGTHFIEGDTEVFFGLSIPVDQSSIQFDSNTHLRVRAPAHAAGTVHVRVSTPGGTSDPALSNEYTYE